MTDRLTIKDLLPDAKKILTTQVKKTLREVKGLKILSNISRIERGNMANKHKCPDTIDNQWEIKFDGSQWNGERMYDDIAENIHYCPWCGVKLDERPS